MQIKTSFFSYCWEMPTCIWMLHLPLYCLPVLLLNIPVVLILYSLDSLLSKRLYI